MRAPFFSIIIPTLNEEDCLPHLLEDISKQSDPDYECIVVDGQSEDQTLRIIQKFSRTHERFSSASSTEKNVSIQRNLGASLARGEWLVFLDADSRISKNFLSQLQRQISSAEFDAFTCFAKPDSVRLVDQMYVSFHNYLVYLFTLLGRPYAVAACMGMKKIAWEAVQGFDHHITFMEDVELVRRLCSNHFHFSVLTRPQYVFSLRRQRKFGKLQIALKLIPYFIQSFIWNKFSTPKEMYPMEGGSTHSKREIKTIR